MSILQGRVTQAFINEQIAITFNTTMISPNQTYTKTDFTNDVMGVVWGYAAMTVGMWISGQLSVTCFLYVCEQMNNRMRREFVRCILRQDIGWFDTNHSGTLATKLFDNLERVKEGTGDKIGLAFQYFSQFVTGMSVHGSQHNTNSLPSSSDSFNNLNVITGQMSLGSFLEAVENIIGSPVSVLMSGQLCFYIRDRPEVIVDVSLPIEEATTIRETSAKMHAIARSDINLANGRRRVRPKVVERQNDSIFFTAFDSKGFAQLINWHP